MSDSSFIMSLGFNSSQVTRMMKYVTLQNENFFQIDYNNYQLVYLLESLTTDQVFEYIESIANGDILDENKFYFQSPQYLGVREATETELYHLQDEQQFATKDSKPCKWCGSTQTITQFKQLRRADEGATEVTECLACKKRQ